MGTPGNLELRMGRAYDRAATEFDGADVYVAIPRFAALLEQIRSPSKEQLHNWFSEVSQALLLTQEEYIPGASHQVIIDTNRRIISHTAKNTDLRAKHVDEVLYSAIKDLRTTYGFHVVRRNRGI